MNLDFVFNIVVVVFTVANLAAMGLELNPREALRILRSARVIGLTLLWGWVVGPALAWLIILVLPLQQAHADGLMLISMAPAAPFLPLMVRKVRGDMSFTAAFMLLTVIFTVLLMPLLSPLLVKGVTVDTWSLAKPLFMMVLLPLAIAVAVRVFAPKAAEKLFPAVKKIGNIFTLLVAVLTVVIYMPECLGTVGSFAPGSQILFLVAIGALSYTIGPGLKQEQRSSMALGMASRNICAVIAAYFGITDPDPGVFVAIILVGVVQWIVVMPGAGLFVKLAGKADEGDTT